MKKLIFLILAFCAQIHATDRFQNMDDASPEMIDQTSVLDGVIITTRRDNL
jgi:hypothetical protein